jgi:hypothetical protein
MTTTSLKDRRYHVKRDGILRIADNGACRYLTFWERLWLIFGGRP